MRRGVVKLQFNRHDLEVLLSVKLLAQKRSTTLSQFNARD